MAKSPPKRPTPPDYKPAPSRKPRKAGGGMWVLIGLLFSTVGVLSYRVMLDDRPTLEPDLSANAPAALTPESGAPAPSPGATLKEATPPKEAPHPTPAQPGPNKENAPPAATSYDFYKILPEMKMEAPDPNVSSPPVPHPLPPKTAPKPSAKETAPKTSPVPANAAATATIYMLQAGAFHTPQEADNLRARLAFMGLESKIQTVGKGTATVWHRVRLGPFRDINQATKIQQHLRQNGLAAILSKEH